MKKFLALLLTVAMVFAMAACSAPAADETKPAEEGTETPAEETSEQPAASGSVYYLNFKPEADAAWQDLAKKYTELTGVPVKVVTAASGDYQTTLTSEMDKSEAPTLFQCGNQGALNTWGEYCLDLKDTDFYKEMTTDDFNLFGENGEVLAAGYCYEAFGIIVNKALLEKAGHSIDEI
ncbi:MAG: extracellular solute-binding protein, partial [Clostridiales bacterium]|nr:extracellular solute-binding protein [Clostridiales bacterium]